MKYGKVVKTLCRTEKFIYLNTHEWKQKNMLKLVL